MEMLFCNSNDKKYQTLLNDLLKDIFLDFKFWYDLDLWDENYESYSNLEDEKIVSNICVFKTQIQYKGKQYQALSLGAVATREGYRGRGYARLIMEEIIRKYSNVPMYLFANDEVLNFYPRFGFNRVYEKLPVTDVNINNSNTPIKLTFDDPLVWDYVYHRVNYSGEMDCLNTKSINIFHLYWGYLKKHIYHIPELDSIVIAEQNGTVLKLIGVFTKGEFNFHELVSQLPFQNVERIEFGFMPYWKDISYQMTEYEADPMFVRGMDCDLVDFKFPELSIT